MIYFSIDKLFLYRDDHISGEREVELLGTNSSSSPYEFSSEGIIFICSGYHFAKSFSKW